MNCEKCGTEHTGAYGSGRFCSSKCARSFSSFLKRKEINAKVSIKLKFEPYKRTCKNCGSQFETRRKSKKFCTRSCASQHSNKDPLVLEKLSNARLREIENGNAGYGIKTSYLGIRCDSALEYSFLKWYLTDHPSSKIERYTGYIEAEGIKYQPDFVIDDHIIVEVKYTTDRIGIRLSEKWKSYIELQDTKKKILSSYDHLWVTEKDIGETFYRKCLKEVKSKK